MTMNSIADNSVVVAFAGPHTEGVNALEIVHVPPTSALLHQWHSVMRAAYTDGHDAMWWESLPQLQHSVTIPHSRRSRYLFAAMRDGWCVGALEIAGQVDHPAEPVQIELGVARDHQGNGVGRELASYAVGFAVGHGHTTLQAEVSVPVGQALESTRSGLFLARAGFTVGNVEDRLLLELPWDGRGERAASCPGLVLSSWVGACPGEHEIAWSALEQQMEEDVPIGGLTRSNTTVDIARMREGEQRSAARGWLLVRTMASLHGAPCGYTELMVDVHDPALVVQESTLVERAARGRGIGNALKSANLRRLAELPNDLVSRMEYVQTYTAQQNAPMQRLNEQFGFVRVGTLHDAERQLPDAAIAADN